MDHGSDATDRSHFDAWWMSIDDLQREAWFDAYLHGVSPELAAEVPVEKRGCRPAAWIWQSVDTRDWMMAGTMRGFIRERGILLAGHQALWSDGLRRCVHVDSTAP
jgi:hypothetical protein